MACGLLPVAGTTSISSTEFTNLSVPGHVIYHLAHIFDGVFLFGKRRLTKAKAASEAVHLKILRLGGAQVGGNDKLSRSFKGLRLRRQPEARGK